MTTTTPATTTITSKLARRLAVVLLALVAVGSVAAATPAAAAEGNIYPTTIRCWAPHGQFDFKVNVHGAYNGQWAAVRHHVWAVVPGRGWVFQGSTSWNVHQPPGPNTTVIGGFQIVRVAAGTIVHVQTDVTFWNGSWGPVRRHAANHFQNQGNVAGSSCFT